MSAAPSARAPTSRSFVKRLLTRAALAVVTIAVLSTATFLATTALPGDPATAVLGPYAAQARMAEFRAERGLDRPVLVQLGSWSKSAIKLDFGQSYVTDKPVWDALWGDLRRSGLLALAALAIAFPLAVALGAFVGKRPGSATDGGVSTMSLFVASQPEFNIGLILIGLFALTLDALPLQSSALNSPQDVGGQLRLYALPVLTLAIVVTPYLLRLTRAAVRDERRLAYVRAARLRGASETEITWLHLAPNIAGPVVTAVALVLGEMIGGFVVIEYLFAFPGVGQTLVDSIQNGDIPVVQACVVLLGTAIVLLNLLADLVGEALAPQGVASR